MSAPARGPFADWPADAVARVDRAAERHGGWARFAAVSSLRCELRSIGGPLLRMKGLGRTFTMPGAITVWPHECRVRFDEWEAGVGTFEGGDVRVEREGAAALVSCDHRATFAGQAKRRPWAPADALYFFGYALANYLAQPFLLSHARFVDADARSIRVAFADGWPAHCRVQRFWFAADGLLQRHDYTADIVGAWATGAHYVDDWIGVAGLMVPRRRRVRVRLGRLATPIPVLHAQFGAIEASSR
jgi:hypothetical protein